ncbi:abortive infection bacteriophage resistance protein [Parabacteroides sp. PF5-5]|uniref:Abi family protein n=1 Tax=unclassified Parabacteroides TaxID=2649774 RepID=UPI0024745BA3|nr:MULTISPECIES: Abi family protein [unclassified Parabacteroides]MDH6305711.1 abortive infection bacteriophage resistance protein [Parabacteroides sp. PH5-39]MDH6316783.1 abortive infection bacteriophage resistance protein [Parabacteroides sp. PF5-13]MDH6320424.1 abortive infection bacteriophage resistance protein [Parabacteroides sp. PH5-13]MDH6324154.1 abortive infection bacteriophage resistance protein [Parabacteroides sp. PH5-8]MDH6327969.1 abortive infection bacteriophage resistance prot
MPNNYTKQCALPQNLISLLKKRGLSIINEPKAESYLWSIGYFRFSAYLRPLYKEPKVNHVFKDDATFEKALNMYRFDRKLRLLLFNEIEKIEVAIRSALVNIVNSNTNDAFWITNINYFHNKQALNNSLNIINTEIRRTKEDFIIHFQKTYSNAYPPSWMVAEIVPLGSLSTIYKNLHNYSLKKSLSTFWFTNQCF